MKAFRYTFKELRFYSVGQEFFRTVKVSQIRTRLIEYLNNHGYTFSTDCFNIWPRLKKFISGYSKPRHRDDQLRCYNYIGSRKIANE